MHPYERWTLRCHLANALRSTRLARPPRTDSDIVGWIESNSRPLGLAQLASTVVPSGRRGTIAASISSTTWRAWRADAIRTSGSPRHKPRLFKSAWIGLPRHVRSLTVRAKCLVSWLEQGSRPSSAISWRRSTVALERALKASTSPTSYPFSRHDPKAESSPRPDDLPSSV